MCLFITGPRELMEDHHPQCFTVSLHGLELQESTQNPRSTWHTMVTQVHHSRVTFINSTRSAEVSLWIFTAHFHVTEKCAFLVLCNSSPIQAQPRYDAIPYGTNAPRSQVMMTPQNRTTFREKGGLERVTTGTGFLKPLGW